ncbi:MAG TPA: hypothetical protein VMF66_03245 [Candidatus Acidoferrum sp.]|nr:hypothetical protein [Candidatus Acidoferrum sp.]
MGVEGVEMTRQQQLIDPDIVPGSGTSGPTASAANLGPRRSSFGEKQAPDRSALAIEGHVGGTFEDFITGWVWDPARPYEAIEIEIYSGATKLCHARADLFDLDLARGKFGNGMHRFEAKLDRLPPGNPPFLLRVVVAGTEIELGPSVTLPTLQAAERLLSGSEYLGRVTGIENGMICGWVVNRRNPHENPVLTLCDGDRVALTQPARERISTAVEAGVMATAYRFEIPLPASLLDGGLHHLSVRASQQGRDLEGSPILFGPSDVASVSRSLVAAFERLQRLDRRIEALQAPSDLALFEKQLTARILDRIDMLLNIHRDSIEREMAVIRRQLTHVLRHTPDMEPDVIVPLPRRAWIEDEIVPASAGFGVAERALPLLTFDLSERTAAVTPLGGLKWPDSDGRGLDIAGNGTIELDETVAAPASLILAGKGARDPFAFCGMMAALDGHPLSGRVDAFEDGNWSFTATTIGGAVTDLPPRGFTVEFLPESGAPPDLLTLENIAVFGHARVPPRGGAEPSKASIVYLGTEQLSSGWYAVEASRRGGICWMGARSETMFHLRPARSYRFLLPEVRPLTPDIMQKMRITIGGVPAVFQIAPLRSDTSAFAVSGECTGTIEAEDGIAFEISFPREFVLSPKQLGLNNDERSLTIAVRVIALSATD